MRRVLLLDNFDSFTWNIYHYAIRAGINCVLKRSDELTIESILEMDPAGFIFSPGPGRPSDHPLLKEILEIYSTRRPILGICLGYQAIGEFYGARLVRSDAPCHGKICQIKHNGHRMFKGVPKLFSAGRYHSLLLDKVPEENLAITAFTDKGLPMAVAHHAYPVWGVQFHPESILTEGGNEVFQNWRSEIPESL